jgi:hypothetical protein
METATMTAATRRQRRAAERRMRSGLQKCAFTDILFDVETRTEELESNTEYAYWKRQTLEPVFKGLPIG